MSKTAYIKGLDALVGAKYTHTHQAMELVLVDDTSGRVVADVDISYRIANMRHTFGFHERQREEKHYAYTTNRITGAPALAERRHAGGYPSLESLVINAELIFSRQLLPVIICSSLQSEMSQRDHWAKAMYAQAITPSILDPLANTNTKKKP